MLSLTPPFTALPHRTSCLRKSISRVPRTRSSGTRFIRCDWFRYVLVLMVVLFVGSRLSGEEKLKKNGVTYLGWQTGTNQFTTCNKKQLSIEPGKIDVTPEKCADSGGPNVARHAPITVVGTVASVDVKTRTISLKNDKGEFFKLFVPVSAEKYGSLRNLQIGEPVTVEIPVTGRADSLMGAVASEKKHSETVTPQ
jgi:hypothetical protein